MRKQQWCISLKNKVYSTSGETIAETLVTMVILSLAVLMLAGAVVSAAKINKKADNSQTAFIVDTGPGESKNIIIKETSGDGAIIEEGVVSNPGIALGTGEVARINVSMHKTGNDYYYYEQ